MTTIAVTKSEISCDLQFTHGGTNKFKGSTKVHEIYNPLLYPKPFYAGFCGNVEAGQAALQWLVDPSDKPPNMKGAGEFVILTKDKKMYTFQNPSKWIEIKEAYYAIGSGAQFALGALAAGKTASEAVKIAAKHDPYTGMGFKTFKT